MTQIKRICLILGSNLGDRKSNINSAINLLQKKLELSNVKTSKFLENKALLKPDSPKHWDKDFLNLAISGDIDLKQLNIEEILNQIHIIEDSLGRKRQGKNWQPREIDIDIAAISEITLNQKNIQIPHKELLNRDFFLSTMQEVENEWRFPVKNDFYNLTLSEIIEIQKKEGVN
jgi:2-amino-4-hydroxy-6-hydroxymethyldihydropteridine diphosphokinase